VPGRDLHDTRCPEVELDDLLTSWPLTVRKLPTATIVLPSLGASIRAMLVVPPLKVPANGKLSGRTAPVLASSAAKPDRAVVPILTKPPPM
jgi:hypothetical protein